MKKEAETQAEHNSPDTKSQRFTTPAIVNDDSQRGLLQINHVLGMGLVRVSAVYPCRSKCGI